MDNILASSVLRELIFDYGVFTAIPNVNKETLKKWFSRNLSLEGYDNNTIETLSAYIPTLLVPVEKQEALKYIVTNEIPFISNDKPNPAQNWMSYLVLCGNAIYNDTVGGNTPLSENFHYCDALMETANGSNTHHISGSRMPYPVLASLIFKNSQEMSNMFKSRTEKVFPFLQFDLDAWDKSLKYAAAHIMSLPNPSPSDFCSIVASRYTEFTNGNCDAVLPSLEKAITAACKMNIQADNIVKSSCMALANESLLAASYDDIRDKKLLADIVSDRANVHETVYTIEDMFVPSKEETIDAYEEYVKEHPEMAPEPIVATPTAEGLEFQKKMQDLVKQLKPFELQNKELMAQISIVAKICVKKNIDATNLLEPLSDSKGVFPGAIEAFINENLPKKVDISIPNIDTN